MARTPQLPNPKQIAALGKKVTSHPSGRFNERDEGLIAGAGLACWNLTDLSLIRVKDLVAQSGELHVNGWLPGDYSANGKARFFVIGKDTYFARALNGVIQWRLREGLGLLDRGLYAGLNPESGFFVRDDGKDFTVTYREGKGGVALINPQQMRRHFQGFFLGEGITYQTLNDAFIMNYWVARSPYGSARANNDLLELTGMSISTIRQKCAREETTIQDVLEKLYR